MNPRIAAIIPMRHDSVRVPGKNWRLLGGKPLFCHIVDSLRSAGLIDQIVIDTDSDAIKNICRNQHPDVTVFNRPEHLRDDKLPMNDVLLNTISQIEADVFLQTHSTNPLLSAATIARAIREYTENIFKHDTMFSVTRLQQRLWDQFTRPVNHNPAVLQRTQDLPPLYFENSCFYLFTRGSLEKYRNRIGASPTMFEVNPIEATDIDEETDFIVAEMLYESMKKRAAA